MANTVCPSTQGDNSPSHPHVPVDYFLMSGTNTSDPAITACCAPNAVNLIEECYLWCEVPPTFSNDSRNSSPFLDCVAQHGLNLSWVAQGTPSGAGRSASFAGWIVAATLLVGFLGAA
ncbi:hypothetical protein F4677DRAFT_434240 [Hypoxylon crocopeplum]|nr:hypothetical protein F4677DRAFT_434240 [Hypoxylon crocopeplum]